MAALRFQDGLSQLEELVGSLEKGEIELEEALNYYEQGIKLYRQLVSILEKAEQRVAILSGQASGSLLWKTYQTPDQEEKDAHDSEKD